MTRCCRTFFTTGLAVQDVDPASRANTKLYGNAIGDARKLEFMEEYFGRDYLVSASPNLFNPIILRSQGNERIKSRY